MALAAVLLTHPRRTWRRSIGCTLKDVATSMGVDPSYLALLETGKREAGQQLSVAWWNALVKLEADAAKRREVAKRA